MGTPGSSLVCQLPQAFRRLPRPSCTQRQDIPHAPLVDWPSKSRTQPTLLLPAGEQATKPCNQSDAEIAISISCFYLTISHVLTAQLSRRSPRKALSAIATAATLHRILFRIHSSTFTCPTDRHRSGHHRTHSSRQRFQRTCIASRTGNPESTMPKHAFHQDAGPLALFSDANYQTTKLSKISASPWPSAGARDATQGQPLSQ